MKHLSKLFGLLFLRDVTQIAWYLLTKRLCTRIRANMKSRAYGSITLYCPRNSELQAVQYNELFIKIVNRTKPVLYAGSREYEESCI